MVLFDVTVAILVLVESGIGRLVKGEGKLVNKGGEGGEEDGSIGLRENSFGEQVVNGTGEDCDIDVDKGGGIGKRFDKASDTVGLV